MVLLHPPAFSFVELFPHDSRGLSSTAITAKLRLKMVGPSSGQVLDKSGTEGLEGPIQVAPFQLLVCKGSSNIWRFIEPLPSSVTALAPAAAVCIHLAAPVEFSPLKAYMHFAQIKERSRRDQVSRNDNIKSTITGNEDKFLHCVNLRFDSQRTVGALKVMLTEAGNNRKLKRRDAMSVRIVQADAVAGGPSTVK